MFLFHLFPQPYTVRCCPLSIFYCHPELVEGSQLYHASRTRHFEALPKNPVKPYSYFLLNPHANIDLNRLALLSSGTVNKAQDDNLPLPSLAYCHPELVEGSQQIKKSDMFRLRST